MNASIVCSGALFYTLNTNRFLFLHRSNGKKSDVWGLVGGTNEKAETPWEGLKREITEAFKSEENPFFNDINQRANKLAVKKWQEENIIKAE